MTDREYQLHASITKLRARVKQLERERDRLMARIARPPLKLWRDCNYCGLLFYGRVPACPSHEDLLLLDPMAPTA